MEFLSASRRRSSSQNVHKRRVGGETAAFAAILNNHYVTIDDK